MKPSVETLAIIIGLEIKIQLETLINIQNSTLRYYDIA